MKINEIMTQEVKTLSSDTPVVEAVGELIERRISGLPVVDGQGKLVGIFTEKDVLKAILPSYISQVGRFAYENSPKTIQCKVVRLAEHRVADLMRKEVVKVLPDTSVAEVARIMVTQNVRRVPVVSADDRLLGIVSRSDVLERLLKE